MPVNRNTLMRIRTIDACLQRRHRKWTLEDLRQACEDALYDYEGIESVSLRTIQRDIELMRGDKLGYFAPIVVRDRKYYEYEDPDYTITKQILSKEDLLKLSSAIDIIRHYQGFHGMKQQEDIIARMQDQIETYSSRKQIVYIETNDRLKGLHFLTSLYEFILQKEALIISYKSFKANMPSDVIISPYLLKEYNNRWFLIGYNEKMKNVQNLALDRIISIEKAPTDSFVPNTFFDSDEYLESMVGVTRDLYSKVHRVTLKVEPDQVPYILTKPLHTSQMICKEMDDGSVLICLQVVLNRELERLILGFGNSIEVIAPRILRHQVAQQMIAGATKYQSSKKQSSKK